MTDEENELEVKAVGIYVLPTEEGMPPRAILTPVTGIGELNEEELSVVGQMAVWTADMGCWTVAGTPLPQALGEAISAHAASLGVPGFEG